MRVALVLGAGGPVGYAFHAGVLAALSDAGWDPRSADLVVGTSMGAVTAGLLRAGMSAVDLYARVEHLPLSEAGEGLLVKAGGWPTFAPPSEIDGPRWGRPASVELIRNLARHPRRVRPGLVMAGLLNAGTVDPSPIVRVFDRLLGDALSRTSGEGGGWPGVAEAWFCAVDLDSGVRIAFGSPGAPPASPGLAVAASCAVPTYLTPVSVAGRRFVDGGLHSPCNSDVVGALARTDHQPDLVILSLSMGLYGPPGRRGFDLAGRRANHAAALAGLAPLRAVGVPVLRIEPTASELQVMRYNAFDHSHLEEIASRARASLTRRLTYNPGPAATALLKLAG